MQGVVIAVVGDGAVGKTSVIKRIVGDTTPTKVATIEDTYTVDIPAYGTTVSLHFIDTSGQKGFWSVSEQAIGIAHIVIVVCDIKREETLKIAGERIDCVRELRADNIPVLLVCNKVDQSHRTDEETAASSIAQGKKKALNMAQRKNVELWFTSAKENLGIVQLQLRLVELALEVQTKQHCCNLV